MPCAHWSNMAFLLIEHDVSSPSRVLKLKLLFSQRCPLKSSKQQIKQIQLLASFGWNAWLTASTHTHT
eukprot:m.214337 g.214337  ORF g.214337 m.214337 type:complete len:68 (+) comp15100_c5_seq4:4190-4393(+)